VDEVAEGKAGLYVFLIRPLTFILIVVEAPPVSSPIGSKTTKDNRLMHD
jgi:hypothetical protein